MASDKVRVRVVAAVVDGNHPGSEIEIDGRSATAFADLGYVEIIAKYPEKAEQVSEESSESAPASEPKKAPRKRKASQKKETNE